MKSSIKFKTTTSGLLVLFAFGNFAVSPLARGVLPPPDGGYRNFNTAEGQNALFSLTTGGFNTAVGFLSLKSNTEGDFNTAIGAGTLLANTADNNTATGAGALFSNASGNRNTANGAFALFSNTEGAGNIANGDSALFSNTTGNGNTALGASALFANTEGTVNTATGIGALVSNTIGNHNTAVGGSALGENTTGQNNTAIGNLAGLNQGTGSGNVYIGAGIQGIAGENNSCYIASIFGQTSASGIPVLINSNNKLGTTTSSKRFKEEIKAMANASEAIFALKPVTFHYTKDIDPTAGSQFGLVAEDVEKINPDLIVRDQQGKPYTVRYDAVNAMLLNEFLKEHKKIEEQACEIRAQKAAINKLGKTVETAIARIEEDELKIRRVNEQIEVNQFATRRIRRDGRRPHVVSND